MNPTYRDYKKDAKIAVDIETLDPQLTEKGTSVYRGGGKILGVSISNGELSEFYPLYHRDTRPEDLARNLIYLRDQLGHAGNSKVFANGLYDLDWLENHDGIKVNGRLLDVQVAEPLLNEYRATYRLDSLADQYLGLHKKTDWLQEKYRSRFKDNIITHLDELPLDDVAEYANEDTRLTWLIDERQAPLIVDQGLEGIYDLEMRSYPMLLKMRKQGVRIDVPRLERLGLLLADKRYELQEELDTTVGTSINVNSAKDLEEVFKSLGLPIYYKEPTDAMLYRGETRGNPSFDKKILSRMNHPVATKILEIRHIKTLLGLFIVPYPELIVDGRIHCNFHPMRSDGYGTVSGRFSSSNPNLQQVSGKTEGDEDHGDSELLTGQIIRKLFIPEEGCDWMKYDYSQIEYRFIAHYAAGKGAEEIRQRYNEDPDVDYHNEMSRMSGIADRKVVKTFNFGGAYGMGIDSMARNYNWDYNEAKFMYEQYHSAVPFLKETSRRVAQKAKRVGHITTILGRRARMPSSNKAYVMFNRLIQGGAADLNKKALVDSYEAGIYDVIFPHITVHDELGASKPRTKEGAEAARELRHIMETCVKLKVPITVGVESGPTWGDLSKWEEEL